MIRKTLCVFILIVVLPSLVYGTNTTGVLSVEAINPNAELGSDLKINVNLKEMDNVYGIHIILKFNPNYLESSKDEIDLSRQIKERNHFVAVNKIDNTNGKIELMLTLLGNEEPLNDNVDLGSIDFKGVKKGATSVIIEKSKLLRKNGTEISYNTKNCTVNIAPIKDGITHKNSDTTNVITIYVSTEDNMVEVNNEFTLHVPDNAFEEGTVLTIEEIGGDDSLSPIFDIKSSHPNKNKIKLSYKINEDMLNKSIGFYYFNENRNRWIYVGGEREDNYITTWVNHFSKFAVFENIHYINYLDIKHCWANDYINKLTIMGIVNGKDNKKFVPNDYVTRAEMAKILSLVLDLESDREGFTFDDTNSIPDWARGHVNKLTANGITNGYNDNTFRPGSYVSRIELAAMLDRALKSYDIEVPKSDSLELFIDDEDIPQWGKEAVYSLKLLNIFSGYGDGSFRGDKPITRAEVCKVVVKLLEVIDVI